MAQSNQGVEVSAGEEAIRRSPTVERAAGTRESPEAVRVETVLGAARVFLAVSGLIAVYLDPTEPARAASLVYGLLASYAFYSICILLLTRLQPVWIVASRIAVHGVDILLPAVLLYFTAGTSSPFFVLNTFALLAAAYRWGFLETIATAGVSTFLFFGQALLMTRDSLAFPFSPEGGFELNRFVMRSVFLLIMAYLVGYLGEEEKLHRNESAAVARSVANVGGEVTLRGALRAWFGELTGFFGASRALLAVREVSTGRTFLWDLRNENGVPYVQLSELGSQDRDVYFPNSPGPIWEAECPSKGGRPEVRFIEPNSERLSGTGWVPSALTNKLPFRYLLSVPAPFGEDWDGRLFLLDPGLRSRGGRTLRFLSHLAHQVTPAIYSVFLLGRMRVRAGAMERARVARELHDGVIQALIGMEMHVDVLRRQAAGSALEPELDKLRRNLRHEVLSVRELMQEMRPPDLNARQLLDFLALSVEKFRIDTGISARFVTPLGDLDLPPRTCSELARIVQEALTNIRKHSGAQNVLVRFDSADGRWRLVIDDDGRGFGFSGRLNDSELEAARKGPVVIKERARGIGGELTIESHPGRGSRLEITFPQRHGG